MIWESFKSRLIAPTPQTLPPLRKSDLNLLWLIAAIGLLFVIIGVRFVVWPPAAAKTFGVPDVPAAAHLSLLIGYRDLWLALLVIGLAWLRQWRALALWFGLAVFVCFADAALVYQTSGKSLQLTFHVLSGILSATVAAACWHRAGPL